MIARMLHAQALLPRELWQTNTFSDEAISMNEVIDYRARAHAAVRATSNT